MQVKKSGAIALLSTVSKFPGDIDVADYAVILHGIFSFPNATGSRFISTFFYHLFGQPIFI